MVTQVTVITRDTDQKDTNEKFHRFCERFEKNTLAKLEKLRRARIRSAHKSRSTLFM